MSGERDTQPNRHAAEHNDATRQNGTLDAVMDMTGLVSPFGSVRGVHLGSTSFEGYDLNKMIDIVESANPALLDAAGDAIINARNAINEAAAELSLNLGDVDWEGEARNAVHKWGTDLATTARELATYADVVGTQVFAASSGLASVRKSMPPRDTRTDPKTVDAIPEAKRVESNDEYVAAVKAEKHRQEAINQMYRLASFYTVSNGMMQKAEEPVFPRMPDVGVPLPPPGWGLPIERTEHAPLSTAADSGTKRHESVDFGVTRARPEDLSASQQSVDGSVRSPERPVGTEIDSVGMSPPQEALKPTPMTSPSTQGPSVTPVGTPPPIGPVAQSSVSRGPGGRVPGISGPAATKTPALAQGRVGGMPPGNPAGRTGAGPAGPVGRAAMPGQAGTRATDPMGRGVVGGMPRPAGPVVGQSGGVPRGVLPATGTPGRTVTGRVGVGRPTDGVVGGRPVGAATPGTSGSRVPRGTAVVGQKASASRAAGERPGRRGVIGAPGSTRSAGETPRRSVGSPDGVIGTSEERASGPMNDGHAPGGRGARRGVAGNQGSGGAASRRDERRDGSSSTD